MGQPLVDELVIVWFGIAVVFVLLIVVILTSIRP